MLLDELDLDSKIINEENTKVTVIDDTFEPEIENPMMVYNESGDLIGSAVVSLGINSLEKGLFNIQLFLDHHTPERLDYEVNPDRIIAVPELVLLSGVLSGRVVVRKV